VSSGEWSERYIRDLFSRRRPRVEKRDAAQDPVAERFNDLLDIRIALVLYGGVSLAIYENGVTRSFYELVKGQGIFALLLALRDASAQVDVIAGTSAGGINGLMLAAALESGADFTESEKLWRELGDLGALLRDPSEADDAASLLKGETYYQDHMIAAFQRFCTPPQDAVDALPDYEPEMDVFITGTDLDGQARVTYDGLGEEIADKEHRVVFHLEHRCDRKALGYPRDKKHDVDPKEQAAILGTIARVTSSFPVAFPPFRLAQLQAKHGSYMAATGKALAGTAKAGIPDIEDRSFADGGLLDNKPFGPVLQAIFHRMPTGQVERRLFYVEPDPAPRPERPKPEAHTPLAVAAASISMIPAHETMWGDLRALEQHNARVRWLKAIKNDWTDKLYAANAPRSASQVTDLVARNTNQLMWPYWRTRTESLARALFLPPDVLSPSAESEIANPQMRLIADEVREQLDAWTSSDNAADETSPASRASWLDPFDADFHLRRSFQLLYDLMDRLRAAPDSERRARYRTTMRLVGRLIKAQKIVRDMMLDLREHLLRVVADARADDEARRKRIARWDVDVYRRFLDKESRHWQPLLGSLRARTERLSPIHWKEFLPSSALSETVAAVHEYVRSTGAFSAGAVDAWQDVPNEEIDFGGSILDDLGEALRAIIAAHRDERDDLQTRFDTFLAVDLVTFPVQFAAGLYELDEIKFFRVSPQDAQIGLSEGDAKFKVAGDELVHFSAMLRRDWRSNDILRGRFDGICQIVRGLLPPTSDALCDVKRRIPELRPLFGTSCRKVVAPHGDSASWAALSKAWAHLEALLSADPNPSCASAPLVAAWNGLRDRLISVGQEDAFREMFPTVLGDHYYQEMAFGAPADPESSSDAAASSAAATSQTMWKGVAGRMSEEHCTALSPDEQWRTFEDMHLGGQPISGRDGGIPPHISGEYVTHAYLLLWGMLRRSLNDFGRSILDQRKVRLVLRHPPAFFNTLFFLMRRSYISALAIIAAVLGLLIGIVGVGWYTRESGGSRLGIGAVVILLLFMRIMAWAIPRAKRHSTALTFAPIAVLTILIVGAACAPAAYGVLASCWHTVTAFFHGPNGPVGFLVGALFGATIAATFAACKAMHK